MYKKGSKLLVAKFYKVIEVLKRFTNPLQSISTLYMFLIVVVVFIFPVPSMLTVTSVTSGFSSSDISCEIVCCIFSLQSHISSVSILLSHNIPYYSNNVNICFCISSTFFFPAEAG